MSMNAGRAGRISPAGAAVVVVVALGIGAGGWAVWSTLRGSPSPAAAGSASAPVAPPAAYEVILRTANTSERDGNLGAAETVLREGVAQFAQDQQLNPTLPEPSQQGYIGNVNSHKFHLPSCSGLPAEKNQILFSSYEEALAAGYTPCSNCLG